jgi:hypothetical protein
MTDDPIAPDNPLDEPRRPRRRPVIGAKADQLALKGVLLQGITIQHLRHWVGLLARVKLGYWRSRLEVVEQLDGPDLAFVLEVLSRADYVPIIRVHRASLGLPRLDGNKARMLALLSEPPRQRGRARRAGARRRIGAP